MPTTGRQVNFPEYDNFLDLLDQKGGPFKFVTEAKNFPVGSKIGSLPTARSLAEIEKSVLESSRVKNVIAEEANRRNVSIGSVRKEAETMLKEMAHNYNLLNVRMFGYAVTSIMKKLFDGIYINERKLQEIRERSKKDCVIFMPSHKTYFDFLLLSLVCFLYDIQLPAIAAGMDFMSMKFVGEVLRRSGAFFMRRSFGDDQLYWAVFSEYVQTHVVNNDRTIEFFVEATRSRVGKSLHPKYGMLQMVLEPYLRGSVFDLVIVPVSMNYDKILEEKLYAYELLGFPKPKESTSGLLKAREILNKKNGNCFLTFGDPISVREYFGMSLHRSTFVCQPDSQFIIDKQAKNEIRKFAHHVVDIHNKNAVITVWNIACVVMLQILDKNDEAVFDYFTLYSKVFELIQTLKKIGTCVNILKNLDADLRYYIRIIHDDLFEFEKIDEENFLLKFIDFPVEHEKMRVSRRIMERSVSRLILTTYSNAMIHSIDSESIILSLLLKSSENQISKSIILTKFEWFHNIMKREFVIIPNEIDKLFEKTIQILKTSGIIMITVDDKLEIIDYSTTYKLTALIWPYFHHFQIVFNYDWSNEKIENINSMIPKIQKKISDLYNNSTKNVRLSFFSTEPIKNAITAMIEIGAIEKRGKNDFEVNSTKLNILRKEFNDFTNNINNSKL
ncbi:unnamed protein product [Caenorhabditis angaria]|uniref:Phospholipid/glycerol acyltransferase domain-containing protein n=1 Tax=Caenorhabditis angaria TaxID=860376 RepID=A0A9P1MVN7_9PELO|nr:unnamed protein product [Caenorhabditis angaria]